ncbi:hypothetical protein AAC387_Pa03g3255 [Persea americana]
MNTRGGVTIAYEEERTEELQWLKEEKRKSYGISTLATSRYIPYASSKSDHDGAQRALDRLRQWTKVAEIQQRRKEQSVGLN